MSNLPIKKVIFGKWLRKHRQDSGFTIEALADKAHLSTKTIKSIEKNSATGQIRESTAFQIVNAFQLKLPDVLDIIQKDQERSAVSQDKTRKTTLSTEIRVAFSALLRIADADSFILVRNLHRPETFGPFGGVLKYFNEAQATLDYCEFRPQVVEPRDDMRYDLRGFLPQKRLKELLAWYRNGLGREVSEQCLIRELTEELKESGLSESLRSPSNIEFRKVRSVEEGPVSVPGQLYKQFRIFEVFDPIPDNPETTAFFQRLFEVATKHENLLITCSREIYSGRSKGGALVGPQTGYLIGKKRIRPDDPVFFHIT